MVYFWPVTNRTVFYIKKYLKKYLNKIGIHIWDYSLMVPRMYYSEYSFFKDFISKHPEALYLESGSGGSTVLVDKLSQTYYSYETDLEYVQYMNRLLKKQQVRHLSVGSVAKFGFPKKETVANADKISLALIQHFPLIDFSYVVVFIDGRCRVATARALAPHLSKNDFILIHDFERPYYQEILEAYRLEKKIGRLVLLRKKEVASSILEELQKKYATDFR